MTILTKPSEEKKSDKVLLPLPFFPGQGLPSTPSVDGHLLENRYRHSSVGGGSGSDVESMVFNRPMHLSCIKSILLFMIAVVVMLMGILGGYALYRLYVPPMQGSHQTRMHYRALFDVPYEPITNNNTAHVYSQNNDFDLRLNWLLPSLFGNNRAFDRPFDEDFDEENFFREEIEMDMNENDSYAKVEVPDFKDGRHGRFMHDFKENQSAIIDIKTRRCFIMPLDRDTTLPPKTLSDLIKKMGTRYYNIDTERVRHSMRVVTPAIEDLSTISERIANECFDMKVYKLEKITSGVAKRSAPSSHVFAEFMGRGIVEVNILNLPDIDEYERKVNE